MSYERLLDDICGNASDYDFTDYEIEHYGFSIPNGLWIKTMFERFKHTFEYEKEKKDRRMRLEKEGQEPILEEEGNINDYPNYDPSYYEEDGFSDSFEYFNDVFWTLIELSVLGVCFFPEISIPIFQQVVESLLQFFLMKNRYLQNRIILLLRFHKSVPMHAPLHQNFQLLLFLFALYDFQNLSNEALFFCTYKSFLISPFS